MGLHDALLPGLREQPFAVQPVSVILDLDDDAAALVEGAQADRAHRRLALGNPRLGFLAAVVRRVTDHVDQRVRQLLDQVAIQLRVLAAQDELHLLVLQRRNIANDARHLLEGGANRHHAQRHRRALQLAGDAAELGEVPLQGATLEGLNVPVLHHHGLRDHQLAHEVDEAVQLERIYLHRATRGGDRRAVLGFVGRGLLGRCGSGFGRRSGGTEIRNWRRRSNRSRRRRRLGLGEIHRRRWGNWLGDHGGGDDWRTSLSRAHAGDEFAGIEVDAATGALSGQLSVHLLHKLPQQVGALQNEVDDRRRDDEPLLAGLAQQRLQLVREVLDRREIEKARAALERVERAEDGVQRVGVRRVILQHQHAVFDVLQVLGGLGGELAEQLRVRFEVESETRLRAPGRGERWLERGGGWGDGRGWSLSRWVKFL